MKAVAIAAPNPNRLFAQALALVQWLTIAAGVIGMSAVLWVHRGRDGNRVRPGDEHPVLATTSACDSGSSQSYALIHAWLDGAELPAEPSFAAPKVDDALRAHGATLFARYCATCHGPRGAGDGPTAMLLAHPPANFTTGTYELRTTEHEALPADIDLFRTITRGVHGTAMPPWIALPERDRWALAAHLKTLSTQFAEDEAPSPVDVAPPPTTPERLAHGRELYQSAGCASCHGATGHGDGPGASALHYASGAPAHPRDFASNHFHRSDRVGDIYLTLVTGLDGTPMASFAKVLSTDEMWDVAMFVHGMTPAAKDLASGLRCPTGPVAATSDELVGVRTLVRELR